MKERIDSFVTHRQVDEKGIIEIFQMCRENRVQCWIIPRLCQLHLEKAAMANIGGIPFLGFRDEFRFTSYLLVKSVLDFALALLVLPFVLPVAAVIAVVIRFDFRAALSCLSRSASDSEERDFS